MKRMAFLVFLLVLSSMVGLTVCGVGRGSFVSRRKEVTSR